MTQLTLGERQLDRRLDQIPESVLHSTFQRAEDAERLGVSLCRLDVGEPAFRAPESAQAALMDSLRNGNTSYTTAAGTTELRERLAEKLRSANEIDTAAQRILVTPGSSYALATIMLAVCEPGDEIMLPEIFWPIYAQAAAIAGVSIRTYPLGPGFAVDPERLFGAATDRTRLVLVNSPANPTGAVCPADTLTAIASWARYRGKWLIGDEAYEHFVYDGASHVALAATERDVDPDERRVFSVHTFSKGYGMTGYRVGYAAAPNDKAASLLRRVAEGTIIAPSTPIQYAAAAALDDLEFPRRAAEHVRTVRDAALTDVVAAGLLDRLPPAGWYAMVDISSTGCGSVEFCERLLAQEQVLVAPGNAFAAPDAADPCNVRVAFCGNQETTVEGTRRLVRLATELRKKR